METTEHVHTTSTIPPGPGPESDRCAHLEAGHHAMLMTFHFGHCENLLFSGWEIRGVGSLVGSMIAIFAMTLAYEGIKYFREQLYIKTGQNEATKQADNGASDKIRLLISSHHLTQTALQVVQVLLGYVLMLVFMSYNVWLCLAVLLGAALGYFILGRRRPLVVDVGRDEQCH